MIKPKLLSCEILVGHALATLPDSVRQRRALLVAALRVLPIDHAKHSDVKLLLELDEQFERQQLQLALELTRGVQ